MTSRTSKQKRVALYVRVSTDDQTTENQRRELEAVAKRSGWAVVDIYEDQGISGANGRDKRPALDRLMRDAARREFDVIACWSVDRLGRSLQHLVGFLGELQALGVDLYLHQQGLDTSTPAGKALFQMCGVFAEFERAMLVERTKAGMARAKAAGKRVGRPPVPPVVKDKAVKLQQEGQSIRKIAKALKLSVGATHKILVEAAA